MYDSNGKANLVAANRYNPPSGELTRLSPLVARLIAPNSGPYTNTGTCTYIVGHDKIAIIDPGPDCDIHFEALRGVINGRRLDHILVTHTHKDHSQLARRLSDLTGAPVWGCAPHYPARPLYKGEINRLEGSLDRLHVPARVLMHGDSIEGDGYSFDVVATPGHTMNHLAYALKEEQALFCGDHVMNWSTTIIAPPDGNMAAYMTSLDALSERQDQMYYPGHGTEIVQPHRLVRGIIAHRKQREQAIIDRIRADDRSIEHITLRLYGRLNPTLFGGAMLSVYAHMEHLLEKGIIDCKTAPMLEAEYFTKI